MKKSFISATLLLALVLVIAGCNGKEKEKNEIKQLPVKKVEKVVKVDFNLDDFKTAREMLEKEDAGYYVKEVEKWSKQKVGKGKKARVKVRRWKALELDDFNVLLVVKSAKGLEIIKVENKGKKAPAGFSIVSGKPNGVGTPFEIKYPEGYVVLAIRRVVHKGKKDFEEVINTPYTRSIDTPEMRKIGQEYLRKNLQLAQDDLRARGIKSKSFNGLVADTLPMEVAYVLSVIEHVDPDRYKNVPIEQLMNEVFITAAANQGNAYACAISNKGARGLFQFMPDTYCSICARYPKAGLKKDFVAGMKDHVNAAKASLLLFDSDLSILSKQRRMFLRNNPEAMGKYLASAYNYGSGRTHMTIIKYKSAWEGHVPNQTKVYLQKFASVWKLRA